MANVQQIVRDYLLRAKSEGVEQVLAKSQQLGVATDTLAAKTETTSKSQISAAAALERQQRQLDLNYRSTKQFESAQRTLDQAMQQGLVTSARHAELSALNTARHGQQTNAAKALGVVTSDLNNRIQASAGSFGVLGQTLSALGPVGVGVAATVGLVIGALYTASSAAHALADKAKEIREFSEATGLSTTAFQALRSEAGKFGIDSETLSHGLSKFTAGYDELRKGNGALLIDIRKINPALADQMQTATDSATAFTLFGKAVQQTDNIFQRNALLKAGLGKGSAVFGAFFESAPDVAALTNAFAAAGKGLDENLIKKLAILNADIARTQSAASTVFASVFAESVLTSEKQFASTLLDIAKAFKAISEFKFPSLNIPDVPDWVKSALSIAARAAISATPAGPVVAAISAAKGAVAAGVSSYDSSFHGASPANDYSRFQGAGSTQSVSKTPEALAADLKNLVGVLGSAATPTEKLNAQIAELGIKAKEAGQGADVLARGVAGLKLDDAIARQGAHNAALGQSASVTDLVKSKTLELQKAQQQGAGLTDTQVANQIKLTQSQALGTFQIDAQTAAEGVRVNTLLMSNQAATAYTIVQTKINEALAKGAPLRAEEIADLQKSADQYAKTKVAADRYDDALKTVKDSAQGFASSFVQGLMQGKSGMDALTAAADQLASKLADKALTDLFSGNFLQAGVEGAIAVGAAIFAGDQKSKKALEDAQAQWAGMGMQITNFNIAAKGFTLGPLTNELQSLFSTSKQLQDAAFKAKDAGGQQSAATAFNNAIERIWTEFKTSTQTLDPLEQAIKSVKDEAAGLKDTLLEIGPGFAGRAAAVDGIVQQQIDALTKQFNATFITGLTAGLNTASGQTFLNDAANLLVQHQQDLTQVGQDFSNDPTLLAQVAATFKAEAQKIVDDAALVGTAFTDFTTQFPILQGVVHEFTQSAVDDSKALRDAQNSAAKNLTDYLSNLVAGPGSTQSPIATLASAQTLYQANLPLAQGGNVDAQNKFVSLADNLEKAARAVYASGQGYQDVRNQIINQGLNLPAVQATTDPVTAAVRDAITAIQVGNAALNVINATAGGTTSAVTSGNSIATGQILPAVNAGNAVAVANSLSTYLNAINSTAALGTGPATATALTALFNQIDPSGRLNSVISFTSATNANAVATGNAVDNNTNITAGRLDSGNSLTIGGNATLTAIQGLQATATTQLSLLNSAVNPAANGVTLTYTNAGAGTSAPSTDHTTFTDQMLTTLYKIEINTWATAGNTRGLAGGAARDGLHAAGGLITGPGTGTSDSIHAMLSNREFVIKNAAVERFGVGFFEQLNAGIMPSTVNDNNFRPSISAPNVVPFRGGGGGGNADLIAEVKALKEEVEKLQKIVAGSGANVARAVIEGADKVADTVDDQTNKLASNDRNIARQRKVAGG